MFESLKAALHDLLHGNVAPADRRAVLADMKQGLVRARMALDDLKEAAQRTAQRLAVEREQLQTMQRRRALAEGINDAETLALAQRYEAQHGERVAVLEKKADAERAEAELAERELQDMMAQVRSAGAGVGSVPPRPPTDEELGLGGDSRLDSELDSLARSRARSAAEAAADEKLAELKRKMGQ